jgi:short-subunit dehydrogenase
VFFFWHGVFLFGGTVAVRIEVFFFALAKNIDDILDSLTALAKLSPRAFHGKICWITGASSGIGKQLAIVLASQGAKLILSSRREDVLFDLAKDLKTRFRNENIKVVRLDLEDLPSIPLAAQQALSAFNGMDFLFNNGGVSTRALARDSGFDLDLKVMKIDFLSYACIAKEVLPRMIAQKQGHFVNISSLAGKAGINLRSSYCAAKFAILGHFDSTYV